MPNDILSENAETMVKGAEILIRRVLDLFFTMTPFLGEDKLYEWVTRKTIAMINALPKTADFIFNPNVYTLRKCFMKQRNRVARNLQNPRLRQIHFYTLRHWKATMEYYRTKDILHVKALLGHKQLRNTEIYAHLINFESDEWHVATAKNLEEETKLIEAGFEYVRYREKDDIAIYHRRK